MALYYADSSVLVKRHVNEVGDAWFRALADPSSANVIITAREERLVTLSDRVRPAGRGSAASR